MAYRYNHPPTWPLPPEGWQPPDGWKPDPAWEPAPEGWVFWLEESAEVPTGAVEARESADPTDVAPLRADVEAAIERMGRTLGIRRELRNLMNRLDEGEAVVELARVKRDDHGCLLVVSDRRLLFVREGMVRNRIEEVPIRAITSVGSKRRMGNGALLVTVAGNAEVWPMTSGTHSERVSESIRVLMRQHVTTVAPITSNPPSAPSPDPLAQLKTLGELRDAGVLTDDEFNTQKAAILARM